MAVLPILQLGAPVLRRIAQEVSLEDLNSSRSRIFYSSAAEAVCKESLEVLLNQEASSVCLFDGFLLVSSSKIQELNLAA